MQPVSTRRISPAPELALHEHPAGVDEGPAVALEPLHDEPLAAEEADAELLLEGDADAHALGGREEGVLLGDQLAAELGEVHRDDPPRVGRAEGDAALARRPVLEDGHEERLAGEQPLAGAHQRAHEAAALLLRRAVAEDGLHLDAVLHVHHRRRPRRRPPPAGRARSRRTAGRRRRSCSRPRASRSSSSSCSRVRATAPRAVPADSRSPPGDLRLAPRREPMVAVAGLADQHRAAEAGAPRGARAPPAAAASAAPPCAGSRPSRRRGRATGAASSRYASASVQALGAVRSSSGAWATIRCGAPRQTRSRPASQAATRRSSSIPRAISGFAAQSERIQSITCPASARTGSRPRDHQPAHRLAVVPGGRVARDADQPLEAARVDRGLLVDPDRAARAQEVLGLLGRELPLRAQRRAGLGRHRVERAGAVGAGGDAVPAGDAQLLAARDRAPAAASSPRVRIPTGQTATQIPSRRHFPSSTTNRLIASSPARTVALPVTPGIECIPGTPRRTATARRAD